MNQERVCAKLFSRVTWSSKTSYELILFSFWPLKHSTQVKVSGECVISSVLSCCSKNLKWQTSVTVQIQLSFIWQAKEDTSPRCKGQPKGRQRLDFGSSFYIFCLLLLSLPCVNLASQEGCLFYLRSSLQSSDLPLFYFHRLSPSFSHCHSGLLFPILTT